MIEILLAYFFKYTESKMSDLMSRLKVDVENVANAA